MRKTIFIPEKCKNCQFWIDTEDDEAICNLHSIGLEKDDDGMPIKPVYCVVPCIQFEVVAS